MSCNLRAKAHADRANMGSSAFFEMGPFAGGGLWQSCAQQCSVVGGRQWTLCDGHDPHATLPCEGNRISLVAFTHSETVQLFSPCNDRTRAYAQSIGFPLPTAESLRAVLPLPAELDRRIYRAAMQYTWMCDLVLDQLAHIVGDTVELDRHGALPPAHGGDCGTPFAW